VRTHQRKFEIFLGRKIEKEAEIGELTNMATKKSIVPIGAVVMTSASSLFIGRRATANTTVRATNIITKGFLDQATLNYRRNYFTTKSNNSAFLQQRKFASSTAATKAPSNKKNISFIEWYESHLESNPIRTKMFTGSILWGIGDVVAQLVPAFVFNDSNDASSKDASKKFNYDYPRTARAVIFGFSIHAPLSHLHFNLLESMTIMGGFTGIRIPIFKAFMEQVRMVVLVVVVFLLVVLLFLSFSPSFPQKKTSMHQCIFSSI